MATAPVPVLELAGEWSSAGMLLRLLSAIESPWHATANGFVCEDTGETCQVTMRPRDPTLIEAMKAGECPVRPSLTEEAIEGLELHRAVIVVRGVSGADPVATCRTVSRAGSALIDGGACAVRCVSSGLAHGARHFQSLVQTADEVGEAGPRVTELLYMALVHPLSHEAEGRRSHGMGILGQPDAIVVGDDVPEPSALDIMEAVHISVLAGRAPQPGHIVRASRHGRSFGVGKIKDSLPARQPRHNPFGLWRLEPVD